MATLFKWFKKNFLENPEPKIQPSFNIRTNPFDELLILQGHTDIVRVMLMIDDKKLASCSDDGTINIFDYNTGRKIHTLVGHRLPVMCIAKHENILLSGSCDKSIKMWNWNDGKCIKTLTEHRAAVKVITSLDLKRWISASNDNKLCVWNNDGDLVGVIERMEEKNIHAILVLPKQRVVTASDNNVMYVYDTKEYKFADKILTGHNVSVQCLRSVNDSVFASASMDGAILVWDSYTLECLKKITNHIDHYQLQKKMFGPIRHLLAVNETFLCAAISDGFCVYNINNGACVLRIRGAHKAAVTFLMSLDNGNVLATASEDCTIMFWDTQRKLIPKDTPPEDKTSRLRRARSLSDVTCSTPIKIGELHLHTKAIYYLLPLNEYSFASCGADALLMVWKDGRMERLKRSYLAHKYLSKKKGNVIKTHTSDVDTLTETSDFQGEKVYDDTSSELVSEVTPSKDASTRSMDPTPIHRSPEMNIPIQNQTPPGIQSV